MVEFYTPEDAQRLFGLATEIDKCVTRGKTIKAASNYSWRHTPPCHEWPCIDGWICQPWPCGIAEVQIHLKIGRWYGERSGLLRFT